MSIRRKLMVPVAALLLAALTLTITLFLIPSEERQDTFWIAMVPILLAEFIFGLSVAEIGGRNRKGVPLFRAGSGRAALTYLCFTVLMLYPLHRGWSPQTLLTIHIIGFIFWLIAQLLSWLAEHSGNSESVFTATGCNKAGFSLETASLLSELKSRYPQETVLLRESGRLAETARFSSESIKGSESIDETICNKLQQLHFEMRSLTPQQIHLKIKELNELFNRRETRIQELRDKAELN